MSIKLENNTLSLTEKFTVLDDFKNFTEFDNVINLYIYSFNNEFTDNELSFFGKFKNLILINFGDINLELKNNFNLLQLIIVNNIKINTVCISNCLISKIPKQISNLTDLIELSISSTNLKHLDINFTNLTKLRELRIQNNDIHTIDESITINRCINFALKHNKINTNINLAKNPNIKLTPKQSKLFYGDKIYNSYLGSRNIDIFSDHENVHNLGIENSFAKSVINLHNQNLQYDEKTSLKEINEFFKKIPVINSYSNSDGYIYYGHKSKSILGSEIFKYKNILINVWETIKTFDENTQKELKKILYEEARVGIHKCQVGLFERIVNSLSGFTPLVSIEPSQNETIANIIVKETNNYKNKIKNDYTELFKNNRMKNPFANLSIDDDDKESEEDENYLGMLGNIDELKNTISYKLYEFDEDIKKTWLEAVEF